MNNANPIHESFSAEVELSEADKKMVEVYRAVEGCGSFEVALANMFYDRLSQLRNGTQIFVKVCFHAGSGRYTLAEKQGEEQTFTDCKGELFGNTDAVRFYKAVAQRIAERGGDGYSVVFKDID